MDNMIAGAVLYCKNSESKQGVFDMVTAYFFVKKRPYAFKHKAVYLN
jgi:hypothetical protein